MLRQRVASVLNQGSLIVTLVTVVSVPWIFGGMAPLARLIMLVGSIASLTLYACSVPIADPEARRMPLGVLFPIALAMIGIVHLFPVHQPLHLEMGHAVRSELRSSLTDDRGTSAVEGTASPAQTRIVIAQWLSVSMIIWSAFGVFRTRSRVLLGLTVLTCNAFALSFFSMVQLFRDNGMIFWSHWVVDQASPFGPFLNPNGAAGWLSIHLAGAVALMFLIRVSEETRHSADMRQQEVFRSWRSRNFTPRTELLQALSQVTASQIAVLVSVAIIFVAAVATHSRAGIIAAAAVILISTAVIFSQRRLFLWSIPILLVMLIVVALLISLNEYQPTLSELSTLRSPVEELSSRIQHWTDMLASVSDFPLLGSGMGAYKFATLPYVKSDVNAWYQHADNQFVEMFVESGFIGLLLYGGTGVLLIYSGMRMFRSAGLKDGRENVELAACGILCVAIASAQTVSAGFDFYPGGPAALVSVSAIWGLSLRVYHRSLQSDRHAETSAESTGSGGLIIVAPGLSLLIAKILLAFGAMTYVPDVLAADGVFRRAVAVDQMLLDVSEKARLGEQMPELRTALDRAMLSRPDDPYGLEMAYRSEEAIFRDTLIRKAAGEGRISDGEYREAWRLLSPIGVAGRVQKLRQQPESEAAMSMVAAIQSLVAEHSITRRIESALAHVPLMPGLRIDLVAMRMIAENRPVTQRDLDQVSFGEPHSSWRLFQTGHLLLLQGQKDLCFMAWHQSLTASDLMRERILLDGQNSWAPSELWKHFGSRDYCEVVRIAESRLIAAANPALRDEVLRTAEELWAQRTFPDPPAGMVCRARHLRLIDQHDAAIAWTRECLQNHAECIPLRKLLAESLEAVGDLDEAENEWRRIQYFSASDFQVGPALRRLQQKKQKSIRNN